MLTKGYSEIGSGFSCFLRLTSELISIAPVGIKITHCSQVAFLDNIAMIIKETQRIRSKLESDFSIRSSVLFSCNFD